MRVVREATLGPDELAALLRPRGGIAAERREPGTEGVFTGADGLVRDYRRTVEIIGGPGPTGTPVRQTVTGHVDVPWFRWLLGRPLRSLYGSLHDHTRAWWLPPDRLDTRSVHSLASLCALAAVAAYLSVLLSQTLTYAADEFDVGKGAQGVALAVIRADIVIALAVVGFADRRGRAAAVRLGLLIASIAAGLGAIAPNLPALVATQIASRGFLAAASISIAVLAAEELPAGSRAYGVSVLSASGALGVLTALVLLPVADLDERAWRLLFVVALAGIPLSRTILRRVPESRRFEARHEARIAGHGDRLWLLGISALLFALFSTPAFQFQNEYLRDERGYSAIYLSMFTILTGVPGGLGLVIGGSLADRHGRRIVGAVATVFGVGLTVLMFFLSGLPIWLVSMAGSAFGAAAVPAIGVYGPELFPTSVRGRANGILSGLGRVGGVVGLVAAGFLADRNDQLGPGLALLAIGPMLVAVLIVTRYPETAHMELEALNPEDAETAPEAEPTPEP